MVDLSTLMVDVSPELKDRLQDTCYSKEDCLLGNSLVNCVIVGANYCKTNPDSHRSWTTDIGVQPDNQSLPLETAIDRWREFNSTSVHLSKFTAFVVSWLRVVADQEQIKGKRPRSNGKTTSSNERTRRYRERAVGNFLILLINSLSESSGSKTYNVCSALAGTYIYC